MLKIPLIPMLRPVPQALAKKAKPLPEKNKTVRKDMGALTKKKGVQFHCTNTETLEDKHEDVQTIWQILSKMDPTGELFVNDKGIIGIEGQIPKGRSIEDLGLTEEEADLVQRYGILDALEVDDEGNAIPESAVGVMLTTYQLIQIAHDLGEQSGVRKAQSYVTDALIEASDDDEDDDYDPSDDDEEFDDESMDVIDEDEDEYDDDD